MLKKLPGEKFDAYVITRMTKKRHRDYNAAARAERRALSEIVRDLLEEWLKKKKEKAA